MRRATGNSLVDAPGERVRREECFDRARDDLAVQRFHGSYSAEHGIGQLKRHEPGRYKGAVDLELMRALKQTIDPRGIMNPGKVLPD